MQDRLSKQQLTMSDDPVLCTYQEILRITLPAILLNGVSSTLSASLHCIPARPPPLPRSTL